MYIPTESIIRAASTVFPVTPEEIVGPRRRRNEADARHAVAFLLHRHNRFANAQIARALGRDDHTTGHYMRSRGEALYTTDKQYRAMVDRMKQLLGIKLT